MRQDFYDRIHATLGELREQGLEKVERQITSPQGPVIELPRHDPPKPVMATIPSNRRKKSAPGGKIAQSWAILGL